jgi:shikimate kinase
LKHNGLVIYLHVDPRLLFERTSHNTQRPLLQVADPMTKIEELFVQRDPLYREAADIIVNSSGGNVRQFVRQIEQEIQSRCAA